MTLMTNEEAYEVLRTSVIHDIEYKAYCRGLEDGKKIARPKGKWIKRFYFREKTGCYDLEMKVCSECRHEWSWDAETGIDEYNFCPNCGADMRGE